MPNTHPFRAPLSFAKSAARRPAKHREILPTEQKKEWIRDAFAAGQREIEVGSFVPARLLPQLADTAELLAYAKTLPGLFTRC
jgi:hydroxymethylglutaryl-CoA lyase